MHGICPCDTTLAVFCIVYVLPLRFWPAAAVDLKGRQACMLAALSEVRDFVFCALAHYSVLVYLRVHMFTRSRVRWRVCRCLCLVCQSARCSAFDRSLINPSSTTTSCSSALSCSCSSLLSICLSRLFTHASVGLCQSPRVPSLIKLRLWCDRRRRWWSFSNHGVRCHRGFMRPTGPPRSVNGATA